MKKVFEKKILIAFIFSFGLFFATSTFANTWEKVHINVYLKSDGSANVAEIINTEATDGSEFYYSYVENEVSYSDFSVSQDGVPMQFVSNWNLDASLEEKSGKWGFNYTGDGKYELCFGKSHMGKSRYVISYQITPLVNHYSDDIYGFNYNFYESMFDDTEFSLTIELPQDNQDSNVGDSSETSNSNDGIWAFGFRGEILFERGTITIPAVRLSKDDKVIVMAKLSNEYNIDAPLSNKTFEEVKNKAFIGSNYKKAKNFLSYVIIGLYILFIIFLAIKARSFFLGIFYLIWGTSFFGSGVKLLLDGDSWFSIVFVLMGIVVPVSSFWGRIKVQKHKVKWKTFIEPIGYYRDCPKDLAESYSIVEPNKEVLGVKNANIVGAYILEMIKDKNLDVASEEKVKLFGRVESSDYIEFVNPPQDELKLTIYNILKEAAGSNGLLESGELTNYAQTSSGYNKLKLFFSSCEKVGKARLKSDDQIVKLDTYNLDSYTGKGLERLKELIGLQKYFKDFTLLDEREIKEVHNWGEMLIYATFLNVAKTVMERLKIVIPEFNKEASEYGKLYRGTYVSDYFGRSTMDGYRIRQAQIESERRSSGGGGSSSFGGGGGSSGGGHGGGSR